MRRWTFWLKLIFVAISLVTVITILFESFKISYQNVPHSNVQEMQPYTESNKSLPNSEIKTILLWSNRYYSQNWNLRKIKTMCQQDGCKFITRRKSRKIPITEYDAVLFHAPDFKSFKPLPKKRSPKQLYVFVSQGAPQPSHGRFLDAYKNFFNLTCKEIYLTLKNI